LAAAVRDVEQWSVQDLPWQISPMTLMAQGATNCAFRLGPATAIISLPTETSINLKSLAVEPGARRKGHGTRVLRALAARCPGRKWRASILVPEEVPSEFFAKLGFGREALNQLQMVR